MRILSSYQQWLAKKGRGVQFVIGVVVIVAVSLLLAKLFQALGSSGNDSFIGALVITVVISGVINAPPADRGKPNRWGRWLAGQRQAVQVAIRFVLAMVVGVALFGLYYWLGASRGWAVGLAIFIVSVASIPRFRRPTTGVG